MASFFKKQNKSFDLNSLSRYFAPPLDLTISQWADKYRTLSVEDSAVAKRWNTDFAPYQREIMDSICTRGVEEVVIMSSAQIGKTAILLNILGYYVHQEPAPTMLILPTIEMANTFSKRRVAPLLRDSPVLSKLIRPANRKDSDNTVREKAFPGGYMVFVGANSPSSLASRPMRIVLADEVDRFPSSSGEEGDPLSLVDKRTTTFRNRKLVRVSTPTIAGISKIEQLYNNTTMEKWNLPCPACGEYQVLSWERINFKPVGMACGCCGVISKESDWKRNQLKGKWIADNPNVTKRRGFHINELASPWKTWEEVIEQFREAKKDKETLKVWVNTALGEPWVEDAGEIVDWQRLLARVEDYGAELHDNILYITAGVDVQDDRVEVEVVGWGIDKESYGIEYKVILGNPAGQELWKELYDYLKKKFKHKNGVEAPINTTCIDSGHQTERVYDFVQGKESEQIFAIKGQGGDGVPILNSVKVTKSKKTYLWSLGVNTLKDLLFSRLGLEKGPGSCHFPNDYKKGYGELYFKGLTAEKKVVGMSKGRGQVQWKKIRERNEPIDLRNYATAALEIANPNLEELAELKAEVRVGLLQSPKTKKKKRKLSGGIE